MPSLHVSYRSQVAGGRFARYPGSAGALSRMPENGRIRLVSSGFSRTARRNQSFASASRPIPAFKWTARSAVDRCVTIHHSRPSWRFVSYGLVGARSSMSGRSGSTNNALVAGPPAGIAKSSPHKQSCTQLPPLQNVTTRTRFALAALLPMNPSSVEWSLVLLRLLRSASPRAKRLAESNHRPAK